MIDQRIAHHLIQQTFLQRGRLDCVELTDQVVAELIADAERAFMDEQVALIADTQDRVDRVGDPHSERAPISEWEVSVGRSVRGLVWHAVPVTTQPDGPRAVTASDPGELVRLVDAERRAHTR